MAKPIAERGALLGKIESDIPGVQVQEQPYWAPPAGLDLTSRLSRVDTKFCRDVQNMMLDDGTLRSRYGCQLLGPVGTDIMAIVGFVAPDGVGYLVRVTLTDLQQWDGSAWTTVAAGVFTGGETDYFSFANFGTKLLMVNGVNKVFFYDSSNGSSGFLDESVPAHHITVFNNRIVLSNTVEGSRFPYRIRWSVKNDSDDWTGDGSGFEDMFGAPGGIVDETHGVFPISDETALIVRASSVWMMGVTGNLLAPHRFSRLFKDIGTDTRRAIAEVPGGVVFPTRENIIFLSTSDIKKIGERVKHGIIDSVQAPGDPIGKYDFIRNEYRLAILDTVWRYNFNDQGWTKDVYPFDIRDMARVEVDRFGLPIDSLVGTIDGLGATAIDDLIGVGSVQGWFFVGV